MMIRVLSVAWKNNLTAKKKNYWPGHPFCFPVWVFVKMRVRVGLGVLVAETD